jgi:mono/diheme cytochrome c family protein
MERLRILGEIPLRKFNGNQQPTDPDGHPDTSFLAKIPADTAFTFQTLDERGMVLNMAQTWHQVRPGEIRTNCGGCHAHSQKPTLFKDTLASKPDYTIFDLTKTTPLLTSKANDQSKQQWDADDSSGLRYTERVKNVEYHRDIRPIFERSCAACHTKDAKQPPAQLVLDADDESLQAGYAGKVPGTYYRLAADSSAKFGYKPIIHNGSWRQSNASRYIRKFQSRRSLLVWKIHGRRLDGWTNDDFPTAKTAGDANTLELAGQKIENTQRNRDRSDLDFRGSVMPPPAAVKSGKVKPLTDEDRLTIVRWIDLGCPVDLDFDPNNPTDRGFGWMCDDKRPTMTVTYPRAGRNTSLSKIVIGMHDYYSGLDEKSFSVTADFDIAGIRAGDNLAARFKPTHSGVWEWKLDKPVASRATAKLTATVMDKQGNTTRIERSFSIRGE